MRLIDTWQPITNLHLIDIDNESNNEMTELDFYDKFISLGFGTTLNNYWSTEIDYKIGKSAIATKFPLNNENEKILNNQS